MSTQTVASTQTITREVLPVPHAIKNNKYCVLEYSSSQRQYLTTRHVFSSPVTSSFGARPVPGDPHAMTIEAGISVSPSGETSPCMVTEHIPGVLVQSEEFVAGYHFGMCDAYDEAEEGEEPIPEQEVVNTFVSIAADAVMLGNAEIPSAFSAGYYAGYIHGCMMIGTQQFQCWASHPCTTFS